MPLVYEMEDEAVQLLKKVVSLKEVSLYELAELWARVKKVKSQEIFDDMIRLVYTLVSNNLAELGTIEGEDGTETIVKPTTVGENYVMPTKVKRPRRGKIE